MRFHPSRLWRWDYAWPEHRVALEVHGGLYTAGHHSRGASQEGDFEKTNAAAELGWRVLHCVPRKLTHAATLETIRRALALTDSEV